jgi:hypothetical protein
MFKRRKNTIEENIKVVGIVKVRELPAGCSREDFMEWWPRLTEKERERHTVYEHKNILTTVGRNQLLNFIASNNAVIGAFAQFFSVGTLPITSVSPGDTQVQTEIFRAVPTLITLTGQQVNISTYFGPSQANGNYSNGGLYGINATSTLGTGTLMTHALYVYSKQNGQAITNDYLNIVQ